MMIYITQEYKLMGFLFYFILIHCYLQPIGKWVILFLFTSCSADGVELERDHSRSLNSRSLRDRLPMILV